MQSPGMKLSWHWPHCLEHAHEHHTVPAGDVAPVKHDWDYDYRPAGDRFFGLGAYGVRRCRNCGVVQKKESQHEWMRVVGYSWQPLAGRCKGKKVRARR